MGSVDTAFHKHHWKWFAKDVWRAIQRYDLLRENESIAVGLSGGQDSVTLLYILWYLRTHNRRPHHLSAIHIRTAPDYDTSVLRAYCDELEVPYLEETLRTGGRVATGRVCAICARLKRGAACQALAARGIGKLAYGHHADDAAETFLMNLCENRKLGSFSPKVSLQDCAVTIVRPLIYLTKETITAVHRYARLPLLKFDCPHAKNNVRERYRDLVLHLEQALHVRSLGRCVVGALERADETNLWRPQAHVVRRVRSE